MIKERVTVQDIADALGLSRTTVSKALNGAPNMPEKTVKKVLQKAKEMNYKQFSYLTLDQKNKKAKGGNFSLFTNYIPDQFHIASSIMAGLEQKIRESGYSLTVHMLNPEDINSLNLPRNFRLDETDAILCIELFHPEYSEMICSLGKPVLFFDTFYSPEKRPLNANILLMENKYSSFQMINNILKNNNITRIGFIGDINHCRSFHERYEGFLNALAYNNLTVDNSCCIIDNDRYFHDTGFFYHALSNMGQLPELFFCANDLLAWKTISALKQLNKEISRDILICGFDDTLSTTPMNNMLTTVHTPSRQMGITAAVILMSQINNPDLHVSTTYLNGEIKMRNSSCFIS